MTKGKTPIDFTAGKKSRGVEEMAERSRPKQYKIRKMASEFIYQNKGIGLQVGPVLTGLCELLLESGVDVQPSPQGSCVRGLVLSYTVWVE